MNRMTIRHYQEQDLESCRALWVELTAWHREIYQAPGIGGDDPGKQFDAHLDRVGPDYLWVAVQDGAVIGLTGLIHQDQEAEIEPVVVSSAYRDAGVGGKLVATAIQAARGLGVTHLCAKPVARNDGALRFFHRSGLDIVGHVELFMKLSPSGKSDWRKGPPLAGRGFRS